MLSGGGPYVGQIRAEFQHLEIRTFHLENCGW